MDRKPSPPVPDVASGGDLEGLLDRLASRIADKLASKLNGHAPVEDRLMDAAEAAKVLGVTRAWLSRHGDLPFRRRLSRKTVKYSLVGIQRWLARRAP